MKKSHKIIYWIATLWLALGMVSTAFGQLFTSPDGPGGLNDMLRLGYPLYFLTILGIWKVLGSIVILIPRWPLAKEWAYAGFFFAMSGAVYSHVASGDPIVASLPALLLLVLTIVSWYFRPASRKLVK